MRKILMVLILLTLHLMGTSSEKSADALTKEERFEMLFGKTLIELRTIVESRPSRVARSTRVPELYMAPMVEEKKKLGLRSRITQHRVLRVPRKGCSRQRRQSVYITLNY